MDRAFRQGLATGTRTFLALTTATARSMRRRFDGLFMLAQRHAEKLSPMVRPVDKDLAVTKMGS